MHIIRTWEELAYWLNAPPDPDIAVLLEAKRDQLMEFGELQDVGVFVILETADRLTSLEQMAGVTILNGGRPTWEWVQRHGSIFEAPIILSDDGFGHILIVPDTEGIDPDLLRLLREHA